MDQRGAGGLFCRDGPSGKRGLSGSEGPAGTWSPDGGAAPGIYIAGARGTDRGLVTCTGVSVVVSERGCGPGAPRPLSPPSKGTFWPTAQWGLKAELELGTGVPPHPPTAPMSPSPEATRIGFGKSKIQTIISHTNCGRCSSHSPLDRHSLSSPTARSQDLPESPGPSSCSHLLPGPSLCARGSERA